MSKQLRRIFGVATLILILGSITLMSLQQQELSVMAAGSTIYVDDDNSAGPWDGTFEHPFQNITSGVANATDGDTVYVLNGTYSENVVVDKSITLSGDTLVARPVIDGLNSIGIEVTADNVTLQGFEITGSSYGVYTGASGFNITDNIFNDDDYGIHWSINKFNLTMDYSAHDCWVKNNTFYMNTDYRAIYIGLGFNYNHQSGYDVTIGDFQICDNTILMEGTNADGIYIDDLHVSYLDGGSVSVGVFNISANRIYGGYRGLYFYGQLDEIQDVQASFGDVLLNHNVMVNQSSDGMYIDYYDCTYLYGNTSSIYGSLMITGNTITSIYNADGIYLSDIGYWYSFYDNASLEVGHVHIEENEIEVGGDGIYFYGYEVGEDLYDNSSFSMGNISVKNNAIISGGYGIEIDLEYFGYYMYSYSSFTMGDIEFSNNTIHSGYDGIYIDYLYYFGYEIDGYASFTMSNIRVNNNNITSNQEGIYVDYFEYFGEYMSGNSTYEMGNIEFRGNVINSASDGIYAYELCYEFGYELEDNSSFTMGDILVNDNIINSGDEGIYVDYLDYFGTNMYETSSFTMGNIEFSGNIINSTYYGIYISELAYEFGYHMYDNSSFTMGHILVNDNVINSGYDGIYVDYIEYLGYYMYNASAFTMGNIEFSGNTIITPSQGFELYEMDYFGYRMYDESSFAMGDFLVNNNNITSGDKGIYLEYIWEFGSHMYGNSSFTMGNIQSRGNVIYCAGTYGGIYIEDLNEFGYYMYDNSSFTMGNITISNNLINSTYRGLNLRAITKYGSYMYNASSFAMGDFLVNDNVINSGDEGIFLERLFHSGKRFGNNVYGNASFAMGNIEFSGNMISNSSAGISLNDLENAIMRNNVIQNCSYGIYLLDSNNNTIYHNVFNNTINAYDNGTNTWDDGYPSGGNYWSDYVGVDLNSGPYQNITGSDGIGDTPYDIQINNQDRYPFLTSWAWDDTPPTITNITQDPAIPDHLETVNITAVVTDTESGVYNVTLSYSTDHGGSWINVTMDTTTGDTFHAAIPGHPVGTHVQYKIIAYDDVGNPSTNNNAGAYYVYTVIPEFPAMGLLPLMLIAFAAILALYRRRHLRILHD